MSERKENRCDLYCSLALAIVLLKIARMNLKLLQLSGHWLRSSLFHAAFLRLNSRALITPPETARPSLDNDTVNFERYVTTPIKFKTSVAILSSSTGAIEERAERNSLPKRVISTNIGLSGSEFARSIRFRKTQQRDHCW